MVILDYLGGPNPIIWFLKKGDLLPVVIREAAVTGDGGH